jgi:hypothetical protein
MTEQKLDLDRPPAEEAVAPSDASEVTALSGDAQVGSTPSKAAYGIKLKRGYQWGVLIAAFGLLFFLATLCLSSVEQDFAGGDFWSAIGMALQRPAALVLVAGLVWVVAHLRIVK